MFKRLTESKYSIRPDGHVTEDRKIVQSRLALTPAEMRQSMERGEPISAKFDDSMFYDGDSSNKVELDPMDRRGLDVNDVWDYQQSSRKKIKSSIDSSQK